jgi:hypothetical protein
MFGMCTMFFISSLFGGITFEPPATVMHSPDNCKSTPPGEFDNRQVHAWFPVSHLASGHSNDILVQIHHDVPGSGCPVIPPPLPPLPPNTHTPPFS